MISLEEEKLFFDAILEKTQSTSKIESSNYSENSPSYDNGSSILSFSNGGDGNNFDHDADSDSSSSSSFRKQQNFTCDSLSGEQSRRKKRRSSSNVFRYQQNYIRDLVNPEKDNEDIDNTFLKQFDFQHKDFDNTKSLRRINNNSNSGFIRTNEKQKKLAERMESLSTSGGEETCDSKNRKNTAVDGLLFEIYDKYQRTDSHCVDSDITELSTTSVASIYLASCFENDERSNMDRGYLETKDITELERMVWDLKRSINMLNSKLVRLLKQRDRHAHKIQDNFNILTALLQAVSQKRRVDTRIRFSFIPRPGKKGFRQWVDALKSVARIHPGIPSSWRRRTWLSLSEFFLKDIEWDKMKKICFNDRKNPDDDDLDSQIVKDLHRTGCGWFFEHDSEADRASLKRVLLGYARWNKSIGYCQGFNVIAALILQVMEGNEEDALKVMIFLVDYVLPRNYFANNLRALSVDMAVLRDLMRIKLTNLSKLLERLQEDAMDNTNNSAASYEPPLINMFTMQWFLTLFATCLPRNTVLRIWDSVLLEGSEVLLRVALAIWAKLGTCFDNLCTAADFYMQMGKLIQDMMLDEFINIDKLLETVYEMSTFPWGAIVELREKYTYDIHPFSTFNATRKTEKRLPLKPVSDDDNVDSDEEKMMYGCLGFVANSHGDHGSLQNRKTEKSKIIIQADITKATPGAYISDQDPQNSYKAQIRRKELLRETEKLDLNKLKNQYSRMRRLQQRAMLVFSSDEFKDETFRSANPPSAINHLFVDVSKIAPPRTKYRKPSNFPALKAPSKGSKAVFKPVKENKTRVVHENNDTGDSFLSSTAKRNNELLSTENSLVNPYITKTVQSLDTKLEKVSIDGDKQQISPKKHFKDMVKPVLQYCKTTKKIGEGEEEVNQKKTKQGKEEVELKSTSPLYQVDKSAIYPTNFRPFPHRQPKRKPLVVS